MKTLEVVVSKGLDAEWDEMADEFGCDKGDVIRRGLAVMKLLSMQKKLGRSHLGFVADPTKLEVEITGLS